MREIHNVQEGFGHAPASTPVDVQCLHRLYNGLANALPRDLATPAALQNQPPPLDTAVVRDIASDGDLRSYHPGHEGISGERTQMS